MATTEQIAAFKKAYATMGKILESMGGESDAESETKLTPLQKLEKRLNANNEKLTKLNEKIAGGKSKIPDKDEETKTKLEETISGLETKISELNSKENVVKTKTVAKPAAKKTEEESEVEDKPEVKPKEKKVTKVAEKKSEEKPTTDKKNMPRITPAITTQLKTAFETASVAWNDNFKKTFVSYVNEMDATKYASQGLESHMTTYANMNKPAAAASEKPIKVQTVDQLHKQNKNISDVSPGVYRHKTTGDMFTGPEEDSDEEFEDGIVDGVDYVIGQTTKRVYITAEDGPDTFVGYWGVGKFYDASL